MALRAVVEPRLISEMTTPERKETMMALRGMGWLGGICLCIRKDETCSRKTPKQEDPKGRKTPTYLGQEWREWQPAVPCKGPDLARCGGDLADDGADERNDDDGDHDVGTGEAVGSVEEELNERVICWRVEDAVIGDGEADCENGEVAHCRIENDAPEDGLGERFGGISDLLRYNYQHRACLIKKKATYTCAQRSRTQAWSSKESRSRP